MTTPSAPAAPSTRLPSLAIINPSGNRSRTLLEPIPFMIGRLV